ncbi:MAG: DUF3014 domain-containing protein [Gammaproteobacteria bacterium]|nr:DUF3014 domain-containing protein [Gammaproteobacteria bacterium]
MYRPRVQEASVSNKAIPVLAALLLLGSAAAWYWWPHIAPTPSPPPAVTAPVGPEPEPAIANPMPAPAADAPALPALADSDAPFAAALAALPGAGGIGAYLQPENFIRHIVATIDNLPRHRLAAELRPLKPTPGEFQVSGGDEQAVLDARNAARYAPLVALLGKLDMRAVNGLYQHFYPLFQRAYQDQGYPQGYFNDRLVAVIDHLLATPRPTAPLALVRPKVFWEFADPELEARSAGQKLLLRIGADNAAVVERKLRELRAMVAAGSPAARAATTPPAANQ